jgi:CTP:molybdopterin cytidylyltransferase MocA
MGREKVLLPFRGSTILETVLATLAEAGVEERVVVLRPELEEAAARARRAGATIVVNPHPEAEMLVSIRLGLASLSPEIDAFFVWPADHPAVRAATLTLLERAGARDRAVIPVHRGHRGHPALVGRGLAAEIEDLPLESGLRALWRARPEAVSELPVEDPGVLLDLDTPEAYEKALRQE